MLPSAQHTNGPTGVEQDWNVWAQSERFVGLRTTFDFFRRSSYEGIEGVVKIKGEEPGPEVGVTVCTHGNEPGGLAAAQYVLDEAASGTEKFFGNVYVAVNNIRACESYFSAKNREAAGKARMTELNMNRLPPDSLEGEHDLRYEAVRARALRPLFARFDAGLDIHTTLQDTGGIIISFGKETPMNLIRGMPIHTIVSNLDAVQIGIGISKLFGAARSSPQRLAIEAGGHEKESTFETAVTCTRAFLHHTGVFSNNSNDIALGEYREFSVFSSVVLPDESYELVRMFDNYEFIPKDTVLAKGNGPDIRAPEDCHALFGGKLKPVSHDEEVLFLARPVRVRTVS